MNCKRRHLSFIGDFFLANAVLFIIIGMPYLITILSSGTLFRTAFANYSNIIGKCFVLSFSILNYLVYMSIFAVILALIMAMFTPLIKRLFWLKVLCVCIASLSVVTLIADLRIYSMFKFHLNSTILALIFSTQFKDIFEFSIMAWSELIIIVVSIVFFEVWVAYKVSKRKTKVVRNYWKLLKIGGSCAVVCYFAMILSIYQNSNILLQQAANLPLYDDLLATIMPTSNARNLLMALSEQHYTQPLFSNDHLYYPKHALQCKVTEPANIIVIMVDSLRADLFTHMPNVAKFSAKSWYFKNHLSGGNSTQAGLFSLFYSIPGSYWSAALYQKVRPVWMEVLAKEHYHLKAIWSSEMHNPPMDKTIFLNIADITADGASATDLGDADRETTSQAIKFLNEKSSAKRPPFFLHVFYNAPHGHCRYQSFAQIHKTATKHCSQVLLTNATDPTPLYNSYLNAVHFVDAEIGQVLETIEKKGYLKNSIILISSDHGQEYNDYKQNYWGHSGNYTRAQTAVPLIVHWPGAPAQQFTHLTTSYDVVPTLLTRALGCKNPSSDYSIGQDLLNKTSPRPFVLAGSYVTMGLIEADRLTTFHASGEITVSSPEARPLALKPRLTRVNQALAMMRDYFSAAK